VAVWSQDLDAIGNQSLFVSSKRAGLSYRPKIPSHVGSISLNQLVPADKDIEL